MANNGNLRPVPFTAMNQPKNRVNRFGPYIKPALQRAAERGRAKLDKACDLLLQDAAGETVFEGKDGAVFEISAKDRRQAFECIRDTLAEAPTAQSTGPSVVILNAGSGADPAWHADITRLLAQELESGSQEPVDLDDAPVNGQEPEDEDDE